MPDPNFLDALASTFIAGEQSVEQVFERGTLTLGRSWRWLRPLVRRYIKTFGGQTRPRHRDVVRLLLPTWAKYGHKVKIRHWLSEGQRMQPVPAAQSWPVPPIESLGALAEWLLVTPGELDWFADLKALGYSPRAREQLRHYRYRVLSKGSGGIRLIEAPKPRLKELQRLILAGILEKIPPHSAAHGFLKARSIKTFAAPHVGQRVILRMDLVDFFPSISGPRVQTLFRTMGYPEAVADRLGGICTNSTPRDAWRQPALNVNPADLNSDLNRARIFYRRPHLPQGAPTSPALANLCAYRMDCRLTGLAKSAGAIYTRYADDLAFSGGEEFERRVKRFSLHAAAILHEEGFAVHHRKTRIMRQGVRQHLAGLVANQSVNVMRADFDLLKAIVTNCARLGPEGQNRENHPNFRAHLEGRVGFVRMINPVKGERLRQILERIRWA